MSDLPIPRLLMSRLAADVQSGRGACRFVVVYNKNYRSRGQRADSLRRNGNPMPEYQLYCFAQSGNAYRVALMLNLVGAEWQPGFVEFFKGGVNRPPQYRAQGTQRGGAP